MLLHLKITQDHIDRGVPGDAERCAIAAALPHESWIQHDTIAIYRWNESLMEYETAHFPVPQQLANWLQLFDENKSLVAPFEMTLEDGVDSAP